MRILGSLLVAALTFAAAATAIDRGALAADPPKTKQQLKKARVTYRLALQAASRGT